MVDYKWLIVTGIGGGFIGYILCLALWWKSVQARLRNRVVSKHPDPFQGNPCPKCHHHTARPGNVCVNSNCRMFGKLPQKWWHQKVA
jgi:hypothetical protein